MASNIDPTKPEHGNALTANMRANFQAAADEIGALQNQAQNLDSSGVIDADSVDDTSTTNKFTTAGDISKLAGIEENAQVNTVDSVNGTTGVVVLDADDIDDSATTNKFATALELSKLAGIEENADVTDAGNVDAAGATMNSDTDVSGNSWVLDEDDFASDSAIKVPTQQSVKAYVDDAVGVVYDTIDSGSLPSANTVTISDIPQTYSRLVLELSGVSFDTATRYVEVRANGDTTGYAGQVFLDTTISATVLNLGQTASQAAAETCDLLVEIVGYQTGVFTKSSWAGRYAQGGTPKGTSGQSVRLSTSAVTSLVVAINDTGNFDAGSYTLRGYR